MTAELLLTDSSSVLQTYTDDVFSTYNYTGGNSQSINVGLNLSDGRPCMTIIRARTTNAHSWGQGTTVMDTTRGLNALLMNSTNGHTAFGGAFTGFTSTGFSLGATGSAINYSGVQYWSASFKQAEKFFDCVTWTGDGAFSKLISHNLNCPVGAVMVKRYSGVSEWQVWIRDSSGNFNVFNTALSTSDAALTPLGVSAYNAAFTNTTINVGTGGGTGLGGLGDCNTSGASYVAYIFANPSGGAPDTMIRCTSFVTDASGAANVVLDFDPQFAIIKKASSGTPVGDWEVVDIVRGWSVTSEDRTINTNNTAVESISTEVGYPTSRGFTFTGDASSTYSVIAVRRPNKPRTTGSQVYTAHTGLVQTSVDGLNISNGVSNPMDFIIMAGSRSTATTPQWLIADRVRGYGNSGSPVLDTASTGAQAVRTTSPFIYNYDALRYLNFTPNTDNMVYRFSRAVGVLDIVHWVGDNATTRTISHSLNVIPELAIVKKYGATADWIVGGTVISAALGSQEWNGVAVLNTAAAAFNNEVYFTGTTSGRAATTLGFPVTGVQTNDAAQPYVGYLLASQAGISKVGWYTGNGATQTINCGFSAGARFVLIKTISATGNWMIFDTVRGITASTDPVLLLNSNSAETTSDYVSVQASGFGVVNSNANLSGVKYLFLAIA